MLRRKINYQYKYLIYMFIICAKISKCELLYAEKYQNVKSGSKTSIYRDEKRSINWEIKLDSGLSSKLGSIPHDMCGNENGTNLGRKYFLYAQPFTQSNLLFFLLVFFPSISTFTGTQKKKARHRMRCNDIHENQEM